MIKDTKEDRVERVFKLKRCPRCGFIRDYRCEKKDKNLSRCLRHIGHSGPHYFANMITKKEDPVFWEVLQNEFSVIYFPEPEKVR